MTAPTDVTRGPSSRLVAGAVAIVLVGLIVLLAFGPGTDDDAGSALLGQRVPAVVGVPLAASPADAASSSGYDIDQARGRWVLVNFFATWCPPCVAEHPELVELEAWGAETGRLELVSIVFDDDPEQVAEFFERLGGGWPVLDAPSTVVDFQIRRVPESFLVGPDGLVRAHVISGVEADQIKAQIEGS